MHRLRPSAPGRPTTPRWHSGIVAGDTFCDILDIGPLATQDEIKAAYRRMIRKVHPDQGGVSRAVPPGPRCLRNPQGARSSRHLRREPPTRH
jgi:hypothetical protein